MTYRSFSANIDKFAYGVKGKVGAAMTKLAEFGITDLQAHNIVDSGWSRASWQVSVSAPAPGVYDHRTGGFTASTSSPKGGIKPPRGAAIAIPKRKDLRKLTWDDRIYFTNNVGYVQGFPQALEERTSFIKATMQRVRRQLDRIARELRR